MQVLRIEGGNRLSGTVSFAGGKNVTLAILSAVVISSGEVVLHNFPELSDTSIKKELLERLGAVITHEGTTLRIDCSNITNGDINNEKFRLIRTSFFLLGPMLARLGQVTIPGPGGCKIGDRPVDYHLKGLELLGAKVSLQGGNYTATTNGLKGAEIFLNFPSAGATQHLMSTACLADGNTVIDNAAIEPEVVALADFLNSMGARIEGAGTSRITIQGVTSLGGTSYRIPSDRHQASTFLLAAAATRGDVTVTDTFPGHQTAIINKLREAGAVCDEGPDWVRVQVNQRLSGIRVMTMPFPGFPTDSQQPMCSVLATAEGPSSIEENLYEGRTGHIPELNRMGANIRVEGRTSTIIGVERLSGAIVEASDLRASAALCIAGLGADGTTEVRNLSHLDRGYQDFEAKLISLGANVRRISRNEAELGSEAS